MEENRYITITIESYNMMNDLLIERANHITDLRKENKHLQKQLEIVTEALSDIEDGYSESTCAGQIARQALKEMEDA